jgi:hypothetical protein
VTENRKLTAQWMLVLGEGRVLVHGLADDPIMLTPDEARGLSQLELYADMADAAPKIMGWLLEHGIAEDKVVEMAADLGKKANDRKTMATLLKVFGSGL